MNEGVLYLQQEGRAYMQRLLVKAAKSKGRLVGPKFRAYFSDHRPRVFHLMFLFNYMIAVRGRYGSRSGRRAPLTIFLQNKLITF